MEKVSYPPPRKTHGSHKQLPLPHHSALCPNISPVTCGKSLRPSLRMLSSTCYPVEAAVATVVSLMEVGMREWIWDRFTEHLALGIFVYRSRCFVMKVRQIKMWFHI